MRTEELEQKIEQSFSNLGQNHFEETWAAIEQMEKEENADIIPINQYKKPRRAWRSLASAAAVCLFLLGSFGGNSFYQFKHFYKATIDVNPGISFDLDKNYVISKVEGTNNDGKALLAKIDVKRGVAVQTALDTVLAEMVKENYLTDGDVILLSVNEKKDQENQELQEIFEERLQNTVESSALQEVVVFFQTTTLKQVSSGREKLAKELVKNQVVSDADAEEMKLEELLEYAEQLPETSQQLVTKRITNRSANAQEKKKDDSVEKEQGKSEQHANENKDKKPGLEKKEDTETTSEEQKKPGNNGNNGNSKDKEKTENNGNSGNNAGSKEKAENNGNSKDKEKAESNNNGNSNSSSKNNGNSNSNSSSNGNGNSGNKSNSSNNGNSSNKSNSGNSGNSSNKGNSGGNGNSGNSGNSGNGNGKGNGGGKKK